MEAERAAGAGRSQGPAPWVLPTLMLAGGAAGLALGGALGTRWATPGLAPLVVPVRLVGTVFLSVLKALVVPLVAASVVASVASLGDLRRLRRAAAWTALFFLGTTFAAVVTGAGLVSWVGPGVGLDAGVLPGLPASSQVARAAKSPLDALAEVIGGMFPSNLVGAAADGNVLGLIVMSLLFGIAISSVGEAGERLAGLAHSATAVLHRLVHWIVWLAPIGIFGLVADRMGRAGGGDAIAAELRALAGYAGCVLGGLAFHALVTLPCSLAVLARRNPLRFAAGMGDALLTALGTASSAATLPITVRCLVERNRVSERAVDFVVPIGTTVNMNGTALYEAVAALFIAQSLGVHLTPGAQLVVVVTATLAAVGAAAIPEAGLVTMLLVLGAVGLPAEGVGLILSIDWILDRFRTAVNVWGDSVAAAVVERRFAA